MNKVILSCLDASKTYHDGTSFIEVLKNTHLTIHAGDRVAIVGPSGSGKSTLLHLLGGLDLPTTGKIMIEEKDWQALSEKKRCRLRNQYLGFVYQFHHLLPEFNALENVAIPLLLAKVPKALAKEQALDLLNKVGLSQRTKHKPAELSGGERQRVAIARALAHKPQCLLADEPTGNLDQATASKVLDLILGLNALLNTALVIVTHDQGIANKMDKVAAITEGRLDFVSN